MISSKRKILRQAISLLTVLWLLPVVAAYEPPAGLYPGKDPATDQLAPILITPELGSAILNRCTDSESLDSLLKETLTRDRTPIDSARVSAFFPTELRRRAAQYAGQAKITIRAPPCAKR